MELTRVLLTNYLPYAKSTIVDRAIPSIDGLKPAQRRVLWTMYKLGLLSPDKNKSKSSKIVGATMSIHPHGDSSIYEAMVNMTTGHEGLNIGYIESKGSFGKVYSKAGYAAARYTEAKLAPICEEMFANIKEDAVDFIDNFDGTEKEPVVLPATFPSILVNTTSGVAVGTSSYIPSFALNNVCDATIGVLKGEIKTAEELSEVLGVPEFTTGGYLHTDKESLINLCETGKQGFTISGSVQLYPNKIIIEEIPYNTTAEDIIKAVTDYAKSGELREVTDIHDDTGLAGFKMTVELRRGSNSRDVLAKLCRLTPLRSRINFRTRVIVDGRCKELGLLDLIKTWIGFREQTVKRIYTSKLNKLKESEHTLATWEKIKGHIVEVVEIISKNTEENAKVLLMQRFKLDNEQCEYLYEIKLRQITENRAAKSLQKLADTRAEIVYTTKIVTDKNERYKVILNELTAVKTKYGNKRKTQAADIIVETKEKVEKAPINDEVVKVVLTENGFIKRLTTSREMMNFEAPEGDKIIKSWGIKNNEFLLVFTYDGTVHKLLVDTIDAGKNLKELLYQKLNLASKNDIMYIDAARDYSGYFHLVYPNGRGLRVNYSKAIGNRSKYISLYEKVAPGAVFITKADKFFIVTRRLKAAFIDLEELGKLKTRMAFKVGRVSSGDAIMGLLDYDKMPAAKVIDFDKYNKDYTVKIGDDVLWKDAEDVLTGTMCKQADDYAAYIINKAREEDLKRLEKFRAEEEARLAAERALAEANGEAVEEDTENNEDTEAETVELSEEAKETASANEALDF